MEKLIWAEGKERVDFRHTACEVMAGYRWACKAIHGGQSTLVMSYLKEEGQVGKL